MTRKTIRTLVALLLCLTAVTNIVPFHIMTETAPGDPQEEQVPSTKNQEQDTKETAPVSLTNFKEDHVRSKGGRVILDNTGGDNFVMSENSEVIADDSHYSADLTIKSDDTQCAALLVGVGDRDDPSKAWRVANVIRYEGENEIRTFRAPRDHNYQPMQILNDYDSTKTVHLDLDIKANGDFTYKVTSGGDSENVMNGNMDDWAGGYIGVLIFQIGTELSSTQFTNRTVRVSDNLFHATLENLRGLQGSWKITEKGMYSQGNGDNFTISDMKIENFKYSANISNLDGKGAGTLMFRVQNPDSLQAGCYVINAGYTHNIFKLLEFPTGGGIAGVPSSDMEPNTDGSYDIKVIVVGEDIHVYANRRGIMHEKDGRHKGESYLGLLTWDGDIEYQNLSRRAASEFPTVEEAKLSNFKILADSVTITPVFDPNVRSYGMNVPAGVGRAVMKPESSGDVYITLRGRNNKVTKKKQKVTDIFILTAEDFDMNFLNTEVTIEEDGFSENINFAAGEQLSMEELAQQLYRVQFHMTPQINFTNDPNGMVHDSTDGYWHLFYQYSPNSNFYKQSQAHVRSRDLAHQGQQPLSLQIDKYGLILSGSAIEDSENIPDLFSNKPGESRLVFIYTYHDEKTGK